MANFGARVEHEAFLTYSMIDYLNVKMISIIGTSGDNNFLQAFQFGFV